ncbi:acid-sensing ion channel 1A-like [Anneissia japonica]|uniref:acid-sensing ion channel 1A-like n=1 Tax=Anneissia japonica TaxID=1529436 RepID=UPI001425A1B7|nr:acid-sensing ion channel 1A-like [Anneissia japonica]
MTDHQYGNAFGERPDTKTTDQTNGKSFKSLMCNIFERTTAHGIPNIYRSETKLGKLIWTSLFLTAVSLLLYQSKELVAKYLTYPVDVQLDVKYKIELEFPAVTICNINPIRESLLREDPDLKDTNLIEDSDQCDVFDGDVDFNQDEKEEYQGWEYFLSQTDPYGTETVARQQIETLSNLLSNKSNEEKKNLGHQIEDLLVGCSWSSLSCSPENFTNHFFNAFHGNCYTFNSNPNSSEPKKSKYSGPSAGLSIMLFIEQNEYLYDVSASAGVRVVIHDQGKMPFPEEEGYYVSPGHHTSIALRRVEINRLSTYDKPCMSEEEMANYWDFYTFYGVEYNQQTCVKTCYQRQIMEHCGCYDIYYPTNETSLDPKERTVKPCDLTNEEDDDCVEGFQETFRISGYTYCSCQQPCNTVSYTSDISTSYWPSDNYKENLKENLVNFSKPLRETVEADCNDKNAIRLNLLNLDIYYQDLNYEVINQSFTYTFIDLVGALGGLVGLWLGLSILTIFEVFELFIDLTRYFIFKSARSKSAGISPSSHN